MKKNKKLFLKILCYIFLNVIIFNSYAYADMMPIYRVSSFSPLFYLVSAVFIVIIIVVSIIILKAIYKINQLADETKSEEEKK